MESFRFYSHCQKAMRDLTAESAGFIWFQLFKDVLMYMSGDDASKQEMIQKCREYYSNNTKQQKLIEEFERTYRSNDAIRWYTKQSFVYKLINKALRTEDVEQMYIFRFFISDLSENLAHEFQKTFKKTDIIVRVYRGTRISISESQKIKDAVGTLISVNGFMSTSRSRQVALMFAGISPVNREKQSLLFEIECDLSRLKDSVVFADIAEFSAIPDENEILFDIGATFKIISVSQNTDIWIVKLQGTDEEATIAQDYVNLNRKDMEEANVSVLFGCLLTQMGEYEKAQNYFNRLLKDPNDAPVALLYRNLGDIYYLKGAYAKPGCSEPNEHYQQALEHYLKALDIGKETLALSHPDIGGILMGIGLVYCQLGDYERSFEYQMKSLGIREKCFPGDHLHKADNFLCIGGLFNAKREYDCALEFHFKSLNMKRRLLPANHDSISRSLICIASAYDSKGDLESDRSNSNSNYLLAYEYYEKTLDIRQKVLPAWHPIIQLTINRIKRLKKKLQSTRRKKNRETHDVIGRRISQMVQRMEIDNTSYQKRTDILRSTPKEEI
ncbi:unnamed protein product [Didymodactylos carnosus]|uniref:NAD(P)(+)--arginine ADP-ribosyltransferase n=1 Tax=Didymodactylos carnosus TaxID=1234261 RepID=A0A814K822_9BILA|nr:unnamed protein product [Didymodactylos carnosus]CAF1328119.1 unnamed protein product [Didymodactylos carnosus]CAF3818644.1 unnamed protein product [Didymodactylos carnosus]CAF4139526.1 unnamed protein product [Didymodactylos carnosus]